jgi:hypothetical protein
MKDKNDLYSIEVIISAIADYIVIRLQKSKKENNNNNNKQNLDYTYLHLIFTIFFFFSSRETRDTRKRIGYV